MNEINFLSEEEISQRQLAAAKAAVDYAFLNSQFYRQLYTEAKIDIENIKTWEDFQRLPVLTKQIIRNNNWQITAVPADQWIDVARSSGTTGEPIFLPATADDFKRYALITESLHLLTGIRPADIVQITYPLGTGMWIAGIHNWLGLRKLGACALRVGPGFSLTQITIMRELNSSVILGAPSFLINLGKALEGLEKKDFSPPRLICVSGENIVHEDFSLNGYGEKLASLWPGAQIKPVYGASEGPLCGSVCDRGTGYHIPAEFFYLEILDRDTLQVLGPDKQGVLAITVFDAQAFPLIRYVLGDITHLLPGRCSCGWQAARLGVIQGRADNLMKVKGVLINPESIASFIAGLPEMKHYYIEALTESFTTKIKIYLGLLPEQVPAAEQIKRAVSDKLWQAYQLHFDIIIVPVEKIIQKTTLFTDGRSRLKPQYFFDQRRNKP